MDWEKTKKPNKAREVLEQQEKKREKQLHSISKQLAAEEERQRERISAKYQGKIQVRG